MARDLASRTSHLPTLTPSRFTFISLFLSAGRTSEHVWVHVSEAGSFADRLHPPVGGAAVEALTIVADQDRSLTPFTDRKVDGSSGAWHERDHCRLVALAENPEGAVAAVAAEVANIRLARLAHPQPVGGRVARQRTGSGRVRYGPSRGPDSDKPSGVARTGPGSNIPDHRCAQSGTARTPSQGDDRSSMPRGRAVPCDGGTTRCAGVSLRGPRGRSTPSTRRRSEDPADTPPAFVRCSAQGKRSQRVPLRPPPAERVSDRARSIPMT